MEPKKQVNLNLLIQLGLSVVFVLATVFIAEFEHAGFLVVITALADLIFSLYSIHILNKKADAPSIGIITGAAYLICFLSFLTAIYWGKLSQCEETSSVVSIKHYTCKNKGAMTTVCVFTIFMFLLQFHFSGLMYYYQTHIIADTMRYSEVPTYNGDIDDVMMYDGSNDDIDSLYDFKGDMAVTANSWLTSKYTTSYNNKSINTNNTHNNYQIQIFLKTSFKMLSKSVMLCLCLTNVIGFNVLVKTPTQTRRYLLSDNNVDMFGGNAPADSQKGDDESGTGTKTIISTNTNRLQDKAARLRQEAAEMEISMREEARAKGIPDEMINKLIPQRNGKIVAPTVAPASDTSTMTSSSSSAVIPPNSEQSKISRTKLLSKMGYLTTGNPVKFSSELTTLSNRQYINVWNSYDLGNKPNFQVNNYQLKSKSGIDPIDLKLDDVGFNYQKVLVVTVVSATVLAFGSSFIGGQIGFILGYLSALIPVALLGLGSVAPAAIGDILKALKFAIDEDARQRYTRFQAGRFLVGYVLGLPIAKFARSGPSDYAEFFQLRPPTTDIDNEAVAKQFFAKKKFNQLDIAPYSVVCLAGSVAECLTFQKASGFSPNDVNTLNELMLAVEPAMNPEAAQNHIKWSALQSYNILSKYKTELAELYEAFLRGSSLEECIAIIEGVSE